jgi:hypothetical protein
MIDRATTFDVNSYRYLVHGLDPAAVDARVHDLRIAEARHQTIAVASYYVTMELLSHMADHNDPHYAECHMALRALWRHCEHPVGNGRLAVLPDTDELICRTLFGRSPDTRSAHLSAVEELARRVSQARTPSEFDDRRSDLAALAAACARIEQDFVETTRRHVIMWVLGGDGTHWEPLRDDRAARRDAVRRIRGGHFLPDFASSHLFGAIVELGINPTPEEFDEKKAVLTRAFATGWHFSNEIFRRIVETGCDLTKAPRPNWVWDTQISFAASPAVTYEGKPILLVTEDGMIRNAVRAAQCENRTKTLRQYRASLGLN